MKKKLLTVALAATMVISSAVNALAAVELPDPVAAYDFTGSKLSDTSKHKLPDLKIDPLNADNKDDAGVTSGSAETTADGLKLTNGYIMLPENVFSDTDVKDITGFTVSMTYTKHASYWEGNQWAETIFCFSKDRIATVDGCPTEEKSIYCSWSGNVGTGKVLYGSSDENRAADKNWIDGPGLGDKLPYDEKHVFTLTYDVATNVVTEYVDGVKLKDSTEMDWDTVCSLSAQDIKNFNAVSIGHPVHGGWGMWAFATIADFKVYTSALNAEQVNALATGNVSGGSDTPAPVAPVPTGDAANALPIVMIALAACAVVVLRKKVMA